MKISDDDIRELLRLSLEVGALALVDVCNTALLPDRPQNAGERAPARALLADVNAVLVEALRRGAELVNVIAGGAGGVRA